MVKLFPMCMSTFPANLRSECFCRHPIFDWQGYPKEAGGWAIAASLADGYAWLSLYSLTWIVISTGVKAEEADGTCRAVNGSGGEVTRAIVAGQRKDSPVSLWPTR